MSGGNRRIASSAALPSPVQPEVTTSLVTRVEKSGCAVLVLTVDNLGNNRLTQARMTLGDPRACDSCHAKPGPRYFVVRPMFTGIDLSRAERLTPYDWIWDFIDRLRAITK